MKRLVALLNCLLLISALIFATSTQESSNSTSTLLPISLLLSPPQQRLEQRLPTALIIGAKKCGTRALLEFLRLNPRVAAPGPEVHFFDKHYGEGLDWYRTHMPLTTADQLTVEKSPSYFIDKRVPARVHSTNPGMKLILVVREPVTRAVSDYTQAVIRHNPNISQHSFDELVLCSSGLRDRRCVKGVNTTLGLIRIGLYHRHLHNWLEYFPLRQLHFVDGERLVIDPYRELRAVERFLGLYNAVQPRQFVKDVNKGFPCVRQTPNGEVHCLGKSKGRPHLPVRKEAVKVLRRFYRAENEKFYQLINRRLSWS